MIKIDLNLLPLEKKQKIQNLIRFIHSKDILETVILICSLTAIVLLWNLIIIQEGLYDLTRNSIQVNQESHQYNKEITDINKTAKNILKASKNYLQTTPYLAEIINKIPNEIRLNSLQFNRNKNEITIEGVAKTRQGLLNYQQQLNNLTWIEKIDTPVSKLFQKENINFKFVTKLKNIPILEPTKKTNKDEN